MAGSLLGSSSEVLFLGEKNRVNSFLSVNSAFSGIFAFLALGESGQIESFLFCFLGDFLKFSTPFSTSLIFVSNPRSMLAFSPRVWSHIMLLLLLRFLSKLLASCRASNHVESFFKGDVLLVLIKGTLLGFLGVHVDKFFPSGLLVVDVCVFLSDLPTVLAWVGFSSSFSSSLSSSLSSMLEMFSSDG